jgi:Tol biopolymer transport system component
MIAFGSQSAPWTNTLIRVVPASGGKARVITNIRFYYSDPRFFAWSPDGKDLTIASEPEGVISNFPISGGDARTVLRVKDLGIDQVGCLRWSSDGRLLGFQGTEGGKRKLYIYHLDNAKLDRFAGSTTPWYWSPDNKWISYFADENVKTRPEGVLWELDVEEALAKLDK